MLSFLANLVIDVVIFFLVHFLVILLIGEDIKAADEVLAVYQSAKAVDGLLVGSLCVMLDLRPHLIHPEALHCKLS
jgi:hypothetical protein